MAAKIVQADSKSKVSILATEVARYSQADSKYKVLLEASEAATLFKRGYKLTKKIGRGAYSKVYLGEFRKTETDAVGRQMACKVIDTKIAPKEYTRKFLPREINILTKIRHPHIVHIYSIFQWQLKYYIFMRYCENGDLLNIILKTGPICEKQSKIWANEIGLAIEYLHMQNIAHRDLKCENIMVTEKYNVKLGDFGFTRYVTDKFQRVVLSETFCGSFLYAPPEILQGNPYDPKIADLWSFGILIFTMLNKAMPFNNTHLKSLYEFQLTKKWKFRSKVKGNLSDDAKKVIAALLEPNAKKRLTIDGFLKCDWIKKDKQNLSGKSSETTYIEAGKLCAEEKSVSNEGTLKTIGEKLKINDEKDDEKKSLQDKDKVKSGAGTSKLLADTLIVPSKSGNNSVKINKSVLDHLKANPTSVLVLKNMS